MSAFNDSWPLKKQLLWLLARQPRAQMVPGYWKGDELIRGPFWMPKLGSQCVNDTENITRGHVDGYWHTHQDAVDAAKRFQEKTRIHVEKLA